MKRSELALGQDYLYNLSTNWKEEFAEPTRVTVVDLRHWEAPREGIGSLPPPREDVIAQTGETVSTAAMLSTSTGRSKSRVLVVNHVDGKRDSLAYSVLVNHLVAPWEEGLAVREVAKRRRQERIAESDRIRRGNVLRVEEIRRRGLTSIHPSNLSDANMLVSVSLADLERALGIDWSRKKAQR